MSDSVSMLNATHQQHLQACSQIISWLPPKVKFLYFHSLLSRERRIHLILVSISSTNGWVHHMPLCLYCFLKGCVVHIQNHCYDQPIDCHCKTDLKISAWFLIDSFICCSWPCHNNPFYVPLSFYVRQKKVMLWEIMEQAHCQEHWLVLTETPERAPGHWTPFPHTQGEMGPFQKNVQ